jgi:small subunit ribosomal protein S16
MILESRQYMLTIRMQRTGRKGFATFRVVVQDSRFSPTSGRVVAQVGHSTPHTKETVLDAEKINQYLGNGAQPTPRVVRLLQADKAVKLPEWVMEKQSTHLLWWKCIRLLHRYYYKNQISL